jgi:ribosomal-protein-alanine N-acetyltransferase
LFRHVVGEAELLTICVAPNQRNKGIGGALLRYVCAFLRAKGCGVIFLEVSTENSSAVRLYNQLGFSPVGRRKGYYGPSASDDALIMQHQLFSNDILPVQH